MSDTVTRPRTRVQVKLERPRLDKPIQVNDHHTLHQFLSTVKAEFRMGTSRPGRW